MAESQNTDINNLFINRSEILFKPLSKIRADGMFLTGYFVRQRSIGRRKDYLRYQDNTIRNSKDLYPLLATHRKLWNLYAIVQIREIRRNYLINYLFN